MKKKKIYIAGHRGMVGSAIYRRLESCGYQNIITRNSSELDLTNQSDTLAFFAQEKPDVVIVAAAKVGGIWANNTYRAQFIYENLMIECNIIHSSFLHHAEKLIFLGSSCIYPKFARQPIKESELLSGKLEQTNEPYAIAKIAGIKLCENYYKQYGCNYFSAMPTNLYGPNDNFDLQDSHVLPALLRKFHESKINGQKFVEVWGTGRPLREFLYVEDLADAIVFLMENIDAQNVYEKGLAHINIGTGQDISIANLAQLIKEIVGFTGEIKFNTDRPDGTPRKLLDVSLMKSFGWVYRTSLREGIKSTYQWFLANYENYVLK